MGSSHEAPGNAAATVAQVQEASIDDPGQLRTVFGCFATGVTVVTVGGGNPHGMTANSFTSVSVHPPLILVCVQQDATMHDALLASGSFAVSVLAAHQEGVARYFANRRRPLGIAQFDAVEWSPGAQTGAPVIHGSVAWLECGLWRTYDGGDHSIFIGHLLSMGRREDGGALLFVSGRFRQLPAGRNIQT
jgi:flavin reductase (DIM6/NTAB) family NADH-FMN oxidoreductase RutF